MSLQMTASAGKIKWLLISSQREKTKTNKVAMEEKAVSKHFLALRSPAEKTKDSFVKRF